MSLSTPNAVAEKENPKEMEFELGDTDIYNIADDSDTWIDQINALSEKPSTSNQRISGIEKDDDNREPTHITLQKVSTLAAELSDADVNCDQKQKSPVKDMADAKDGEKENIGMKLLGRKRKCGEDVFCPKLKKMRYFIKSYDDSVEWVNPVKLLNLGPGNEVSAADEGDKEDNKMDSDDLSANNKSMNIPTVVRRSERLKKEVKRLEYNVIIPRRRTPQNNKPVSQLKKRKAPKKKIVWTTVLAPSVPSMLRNLPFKARSSPILAAGPPPVPAHISYKNVRHQDLKLEVEICERKLVSMDYGRFGLDIVLALKRLNSSIRKFEKHHEEPTALQSQRMLTSLARIRGMLGLVN